MKEKKFIAFLFSLIIVVTLAVVILDNLMGFEPTRGICNPECQCEKRGYGYINHTWFGSGEIIVECNGTILHLTKADME